MFTLAKVLHVSMKKPVYNFVFLRCAEQDDFNDWLIFKADFYSKPLPFFFSHNSIGQDSEDR